METSEPDQARLNWSDYFLRGCTLIGAALLCLPLGFCGWVAWYEPRSALPEEVEWTDIIGFNSEFAFREGCVFGAYRISASSASAFASAKYGPPKWQQTPLRIEEGQYAFVGPTQDRVTLYALHATSCAPDDQRGMIRQMHAALSKSGSWYHIYNHGEGFVVVDPSTRLAWYLYYG